MNDCRFAVRQLLKNPGLTLVVVLSLAVGIGANAIVFTWIRSTLLDAIPGATEPRRLAVLVPRHKSGEVNDTMSLADIESVAAQTNIFSAITASQFGAVWVRLEKTPEWLWGQNTLANFFDVLGAAPVLGRGFLPGEDRPGAKDRVAVISHALWQQRFHGAPDVLGKVIELNQRPVTIVGVAAPGFFGTMGGLRFDLWVPLATERDGQDLQTRYTSRGWRWLHTVARLAPGVSLREAKAAADVVGQRLAKEFPETSKDTTMSVLRMWESPRGGQALFLPLLRALAVVAGLLLLLVAANVANLLLARAHARQSEMGVRLALGASGGRLMRQLLTESLLLAVLGGAGGVALAVWGAHGLLDLMPATYLPVGYNLGLNWGVLAATAVVTLVTGLLFGLAPAWNAARTNLNETLKTGGRAAFGIGPRQWLRRALVVSEIALALVLLLSMGLCARSFSKARQMDLGLDPRGVWVAGFRLSPHVADMTSTRSFYQRLRREAARLPGVETVGLSSWFPLGFEGGSSSDMKVPGYVPTPGESMNAGVSTVSPGYFDTLRIPMLAGRDFTDADDLESPVVGVVNEAFARKYLAGRDPVGLTFNFWLGDVRIIGVVKTGKYSSLNEPAWPFVYVSAGQTDARDLGLAVRTTGNPRQIAGEIERLAVSIDPNASPHAAMTYEDYVAAAFTLPRVAATLLSVLGGLALLLAVMGIYAVISHGASQRTREFGVRLALGAQPAAMMRLILRQGLGLALAGLGLGVVAGIGASRALAGLLVGVTAADTVTWILVPVVLLGAAFAACWLPARRAARIDLMKALRDE